MKLSVEEKWKHSRTTLSPILFNYGIKAICGSKVIDINKVIRSISEGATFKEVTGVRLLTLNKI